MNGPDALARFDLSRLRHPRLEAVDRELREAIAEPAGADVIQLIGPSGVGKTTLVDGVARRLEDELRDRYPAARQPLLRFDAPETTKAGFSLKSFYLEALTGLGEPDLDAKVPLARPGQDDLESIRKHRTPEWVMREGFRTAARELGVRVVLVDEAQHLCLTDEPRTRTAIFDALKTFHAATGALIVLFGTYDLQRFVNLNGQLARRGPAVHFSRYGPSTEDQVAWVNILRWFQERLGVDAPDLVERADRMYAGSLGCVGVLKLWLQRALARMVLDGRTRLLVSDLDRNAYSTAARRRMVADIKEGERLFADDPLDEDFIREALGLPARVVKPAADHAPRTPFERTLRRDPVGSTADPASA